jgi:hypothetical protein
MIYFKNKRKKAQDWKVLFIDDKNWPAFKIYYAHKRLMDISGVHEFTYIPEEVWFP